MNLAVAFLNWLYQVLSDASISALVKDHMIILGATLGILKAWAKLHPSVTSNTITELFSQIFFKQDITPPSADKS